MKNENLKIANAFEELRQFENTPKALECLDIYRRVPEKRRGILLMVMDAFALGMEAGVKTKVKS